jgi:hypothetical protein
MHPTKLLLLLAATALSLSAENLTLESGLAKISWDLAGGGLIDFQFKDQPLNPFTWEEKSATAAHLKGHFLCLDRWGAPSAAEIGAGVPFHGEASRVEWRQIGKTAGEAEMTARLVLARLGVKRTIKLDGASALVTEAVTNEAPLGRVFNMVQHPTIGPPFLDETVVVDSNARQGFMQSSPMPNPEHPTVVWPQALKDGIPVNLRRLEDDPMPNVVSYVIDEDYGWVTALNPGKRLVLGYIWKTAEYPWLNIWRHVEAGKPFARGLEFGTTGLHQPYPVLTRKGSIFGRPLMAFIDATETQTRRYQVFLAKLPATASGVSQVRRTGSGDWVLVTRENQELRVKDLLAGQ